MKLVKIFLYNFNFFEEEGAKFVGVMLKQSESALMLSQCTLAQSIEEAISAENSAISIFLSLRKVSSFHDKAGHGKPIGH